MDHYSPTQAPVEIDHDPATGVAQLSYSGAVSAAGLHAAHEALHSLLKGRAVIGLVIDVRGSTPVYSSGELLEAMESCIADWPIERVALVTRADRARLVMLMETVGFPQGVRVRVFADDAEARRFAAGV